MDIPAFYRKFKQWILIITVPLFLLSIFTFQEKKPIACSRPCDSNLFPTYKAMSDCKKVDKYVTEICTKRCFDCESANDVSCLKAWLNTGQAYHDSFDSLNESLGITQGSPSKKQIMDNADTAFTNENCNKFYNYSIASNSDSKCVDASSNNVIDSMDKVSKNTTVAKDFTKVFNYKMAACLYGMSLMTIFWIFEIIPLAVTALIPLFLYPAMGILTAKYVASFYFTDIIALFFGGLVVAYAIEKVNLHRRMALKVLTMVGPRPVWILFGFMVITSFISMWISNVATTAMILPIALAVITQLKSNLDDQAVKDGYKDVPTDDEKVPMLQDTEQGEDENNYKARYHAQSQLSKALVLSICYCASIGGTGMMTGTGPNMIFAGMMPEEAGVTFGAYAVYAFPICWIMTFFAWGVLTFFFLTGNIEQTPEQLASVTDLIQDQYQKLGKMKFAEKVVGLIAFVMAMLWLTRKPSKTIPGWSDIPGLDSKDVSGKPYVKDATPAMLMAFLLFILPNEAPNMDLTKSLPPPILTFKDAASKVQWSVLFLLGGGFAMAKGVSTSEFAVFLGTKLEILSTLPEVLVIVICTYFIWIMTQTCANSATITIFLPIFLSLAGALKVNCLLIMVPCVSAVSFAFLLPVSTPPNAVCCGYGYLEMKDLLKSGSILGIVGVPICVACTYIFGRAAYPDMMNPCAQWFVDLAKNADLIEHCRVLAEKAMS